MTVPKRLEFSVWTKLISPWSESSSDVHLISTKLLSSKKLLSSRTLLSSRALFVRWMMKDSDGFSTEHLRGFDAKLSSTKIF